MRFNAAKIWKRKNMCWLSEVWINYRQKVGHMDSINFIYDTFFNPEWVNDIVFENITDFMNY